MVREIGAPTPPISPLGSAVRALLRKRVERRPCAIRRGYAPAPVVSAELTEGCYDLRPRRCSTPLESKSAPVQALLASLSIRSSHVEASLGLHLSVLDYSAVLAGQIRSLLNG